MELVLQETQAKRILKKGEKNKPLILLKTFHTKHHRLVPEGIAHGIRNHSPLSLTFLESFLFLHECFIPGQNSYIIASFPNPDIVAAHLKVSGLETTPTATSGKSQPGLQLFFTLALLFYYHYMHGQPARHRLELMMLSCICA